MAQSETDKALSPALEDYLEAIAALVHENQVARVRDIAKHLDVGMPSVTAALKALAKRGLVNYDPYELITLTDAGRDVAQGITGKHEFLRQFLTEVLGLDDATAEANACRMEHAVDQAALDRLAEFVAYIRACPAVRGWMEHAADSRAGQGESQEP